MHLGDLERDLQQKLSQERKQIEQLHSAELEKLKNNLEQECSRVLTTIKADMEITRRTINTQWKWFLLLPGATILSLLIVFLVSSWLMMQSLVNQAKEIQTQKQTLEILKEKTWGIEIYQTKNGRFLILPPDTEYQTNWRCNGKPCLKL